jgi:transposase
MVMGKKQASPGVFWVAAQDIAASPGNPFYERLNRFLDKHKFDQLAEKACRPYYADTMGRPSIPPGVYFRMLFVGYFEGLDSERGICWRVADSRSLGAFLGLDPTKDAPTHVSLQNTRNRLPLEVHQEIFTQVLSMLAKEGLLKGKTLGVDATTLEANAALRAIVRKDTGEDYPEYLKRLAEASGVETPTKEALIRFDRSRKGKKMSNAEWEHPQDPDARIGLTKHGACDMVHKCEAASDLETGAVVAVTMQAADLGDTTTITETLAAARENLEAVAARDVDSMLAVSLEPASEVVADKGYHSNACLSELDGDLVRTYVSEPERGRRNWAGKETERDAVYANRRRIRGRRGKRLFKRRAEICERNFAHLFEGGGMRRTHLRGHRNILKRLLIHACGLNLGLVMRKMYRMGTPRGMAELAEAALAAVSAAKARVARHWGGVLPPIPYFFRCRDFSGRSRVFSMTAA